MSREITIEIGGSPPQEVDLVLSTDFGFDTGAEVSGPVNPVSLEFFQPMSFGSTVSTSSGSVLSQQWVDERVTTLIEDDSLFSFSNGELLTVSEETNIVSHFVGPQLAAGDPSQWSAYEFTGEFLREDSLGGIGVTFHSQHPGTSGYYRLRMFAGFPNPFDDRLHLTGDTGATWTGNRDLGFTPIPNVWYSFRILIELSGGVRIRARVWPTGDSEPVTWQADATDTASLYTQGTVGAWCMASGAKRWKNFTVNESGSAEALPMVRPLSLSISASGGGVLSGEAADEVQFTAELSGGDLTTPQDVTSQTEWVSSSPAHLTIDSSGLGTAHDPGTSETVTVTGTHLTLQDTAQVLVTTGTGGGGDMLATIHHVGVTFSLDQPYESGCHLDGSPYIVVGVGGSCQLAGLPHRQVNTNQNGGCLDQFITLEFAETVQGGDSGSRYANQRSQGWTSRTGESPGSYDASLNDTKFVDPNNPATWLTITPQFNCTGSHAGKYSQLVVQVDTGSVSNPFDNNQPGYSGSTTMSYGILTVYELAPPANSFRPGVERGDQPVYTVSDIDYNVLADIPLESGAPSTVDFGSPGIQYHGTYFLRSPFFPVRYDTTRRYLHPVTSTGNAFVSQNAVPYLGNCALWLNSDQFDVLNEEHRKILYRMIQAGIDCDSIRTESGTLGGHHGGVLPTALFARKILGLGVHSKGTTFQEVGTTFFVRNADVFTTGNSSAPCYNPSSQWVGAPEWSADRRIGFGGSLGIYEWWSTPPRDTGTGTISGTTGTVNGLTPGRVYKNGMRLRANSVFYTITSDVTVNGSGTGTFPLASSGSFTGSIQVWANAITASTSYRTTNSTRQGLGQHLALALMGVTRAEYHSGIPAWIDAPNTAGDALWDYMERYHTLESGSGPGAYQKNMWLRYRDVFGPSVELLAKWGRKFGFDDDGIGSASTVMAIEGQGVLGGSVTQITAGTTLNLYSRSVVPDSPTYLWEVQLNGGGYSSIGSTKDVTYNFPSAGTYDIRLTVSGLAQTRTGGVVAT